jgi:autotransporter-associated beta strand protein
VTINNPVVLQSDSSLNVPGASSTLTLSGGITGAGRLELGTLPGDPLNQGTLTLTSDNSYLGGTTIIQGTLILNAAAADLGTGNVTVDGVSTGASGSVANGKLTIQTGVLNAISDSAILTLTGGTGTGLADGGFATLSSGINETVRGLVLGGISQGPGTYGSTASAATFKSPAFDEYFSTDGTGIITVVPEPGAAAMLLGSLGTLLSLQRFRRSGKRWP